MCMCVHSLLFCIVIICFDCFNCDGGMFYISCCFFSDGVLFCLFVSLFVSYGFIRPFLFLGVAPIIMTFMVDWALKANDLIFYLLLVVLQWWCLGSV